MSAPGTDELGAVRTAHAAHHIREPDIQGWSVERGPASHLRAGDSPRRRGQDEDEAAVENERWLVTYADMLTVLMALFIVMFAISVADKEKFEALKSGVAAGAGLLTAGEVIMTEDAESSAVPVLAATAQEALERARVRDRATRQMTGELVIAQRQLELALSRRGLRNQVQFSQDERGLVVSIVTDQVLFPLGSADLGPQGRLVIDAIRPVLARLPHAITVEGHTDDLPLDGHGRFATNWELSANRATAVLRYMLDVGGISPSRVSAFGYADQRPLVPNTPSQRARNRRVEVVLRPQPYDAPDD